MRPVFVGGTGRSGTTLVKRILMRSSMDVVACPGEFRLVSDPDGLLDLWSALSRRWTPFTASLAWHRFAALCTEGWGTKLRWDAGTMAGAVAELADALGVRRLETAYPFDAPAWEVAPCDDPAPLAAFTDRLFGAMRAHASVWLDDTPETALRAAEIHEVWPDAIVVEVRRDAATTAASMAAQFARHGKWWPHDDEGRERRVRWTHERSAADVLITLERLADAPEQTTRQLCAVTRLEWHHTMPQLVDANRVQRPAA